MRWYGWMLLGLMACSGGIGGVEADARAALVDGQFGQAMEKANTGVGLAQTSGDRAARWRFELIILEAMARSGQGLAVVGELTRLAVDFPQQVNAKLYLTLGSYARDAGDTNGAIELWAAGDKQFPEQSSSFKSAIDALQRAGTLAPEELKKLKSLGYIQ